MAHKVVITGINTSDLPKLNTKETEELLIEIKKGSIEAREKFIESNLRLVLSMVQRFNTEKVSSDDLFQVGIIGLIKAVDNFNVNYKVRFSTYAVPMILGEIRRFIRESTALKVGRSIRDVAYKAMCAREKLEMSSSEEITISQIAREINLPYYEVVGALDAISEPVSIYENVYNDDEDGALVVDKIRDPETEEERFYKISLREGIDNLPEKEKEIINLRYYKGKTQMEISTELNMSQAQVSRLENSAIKQLRSVL